MPDNSDLIKRPPRITVISDELDAGSRLVFTLKANGYCVESFADFHDVLAVLSQVGCDLILAEADIPGINGAELLNSIRMVAPGVPVILLAGSDHLKLAMDAVKSGAFDLIPKPVDPEFLLLVVNKAVRYMSLCRAERDNDTRLQAILDTVMDSVVTIDRQGIIQSFNLAASRLFGY